MALKLMYITNRPEVALIAESAGVDRIFVDLEWIGKAERQGGMDTVQSRHTVEDIAAVRKVLTKADLLVRCNPIHEASSDYESSAEEIERIVECGADLIMLPYFKTPDEVRTFIRLVNGRAKTVLLLETPEAAMCVDEILEIDGIDEVFIGLNDLSLGYQKKFMFELLADGTVERLCVKMKQKRIPHGFGGIASLGQGALPAERIIREHYRLGSTSVILSRSFCNTTQIQELNKIREIFEQGVPAIRALEEECDLHSRYFAENQEILVQTVQEICQKLYEGV